MRLISWNVNGLRACVRKGFVDWLAKSDADLVAVQEVRARVEQLPEAVARPAGYHTHFVAAERKGYSGVGLFSRRQPDAVTTSLGDDAFDREGRLQITHFGALRLVNAYFPNGNGKNRSNDRVPYKLAFYRALREKLQPDIDAGAPIFVVGDFNTAHRAIDLARPKTNKKTSGFTDEERQELDTWLEAGWRDTFREQHPDREGCYSWWRQSHNLRERNVGWRIDYILASPGAFSSVRDAFILTDVMGSDHCPVGIDWVGV